MLVKLCWEESFINWLIGSKTLRQRMGNKERALNCTQLDQLVFDDVHPFFESIRAEVRKDSPYLRAMLAEGIAEVEHAVDSLGTTTVGLEEWLKRAKSVLG
jgi:hypothetical protein